MQVFLKSAGRRGSLMALAVGLFLGSAALQPAHADLPSDWDIQEALVEKLNAEKMFDLAELQVQVMKEQYKTGAKQQELLILEASVYVADRKREKALEVLAKVSATSPSAKEALLLSARLEDDPAKKEAQYSAYFKKGKPGNEKEAITYRSAVVSSATNLMEMGKSAEALKRLDLLGNVIDSKEGDNRRLDFEVARLLLDSAANAKADGKPAKDYEPFVKQAEAKLSNLQWEMDPLAALTYVEVSRALIIRGSYDEAVNQLNDPAVVDFLKNVEKGFVDEGYGYSMSPLAGCYFYNGEAHFELAKEANRKKQNKEDLKNHLIGAANSYFIVVKTYGKSPYGKDATARLGEVKDIMAKLGMGDIEIGSAGDRAVIVEQGMKAFKEQDFDSAAGYFERALKADPLDKEVPTIGRSLVVCLLQTPKRQMDAATYADFLGHQFPDDPNTHDALYLTGAVLAQLSRKAEAATADMPDGKNKESALLYAEAARGYSNVAFIRLVEIAGAYPKASLAGWQVAETYYGDAMEARAVARKAEQEGDKELEAAKDAEMQANLKAAAPIYESLTRNHGHTQYGVLAYYKLGWAYLFLEEDSESALNFVLYTEADTAKTAQRATAKFRAAERYMRADENDAAIQHFTEYLEWTKGKDYPMDDTLLAFRSDAEAYIAWCYDRRAKSAEEKVGYFETEVATYQAKIDDGSAKKDYEQQIADAGENADGIPTPDERVATLKQSLVDAQEEAKALRKNAVDQFKAYIGAHPTDERQVPAMMIKLGNYYAKTGDITESTKWFLDLQNRFGHTDEGKTSIFLLLVQLVETGQTDEAKKLADTLAGRIGSGEFSDKQVSAVADMMIITDEKTGAEKLIDLNLAAKANDALIAKGKKAPDSDRTAKSVAMLSYSRLAKSYFLAKDYGKVVSTVDDAMAFNDKTPFYFQLQFYKGESLARQDKVRDAIVVFGEAINMMGDNTQKYQKEYYSLVEASLRLRLAQNSEADARKAVAEGLPLVKYSLIDDPEVKPQLESILYHFVQGAALLGETKLAEEYQSEYIQRFPEGKYKADILALPPKRY